MISLFLHFLFFPAWEFLSNEWLTLAHMWFCLQFLVHLQKGQCGSEPHQTIKINIVFGLDQCKWTSGLSWCEYTLRVQKKNLNIEKMAYKVVQIKSLAIHITNQKLSFDIFTVEYLQNIFMEHDLYLIS